MIINFLIISYDIPPDRPHLRTIRGNTIFYGRNFYKETQWLKRLIYPMIWSCLPIYHFLITAYLAQMVSVPVQRSNYDYSFESKKNVIKIDCQIHGSKGSSSYIQLNWTPWRQVFNSYGGAFALPITKKETAWRQSLLWWPRRDLPETGSTILSVKTLDFLKIMDVPFLHTRTFQCSSYIYNAKVAIIVWFQAVFSVKNSF